METNVKVKIQDSHGLIALDGYVSAHDASKINRDDIRDWVWVGDTDSLSPGNFFLSCFISKAE